MDILQVIQGNLNPETYNKIIEQKRPVASVIMQKVFPEGVRTQRATAMIAMSEIVDRTKNIPVIKRGGHAYPISGDSIGTVLVEPAPIRPIDNIAAKTINDWRGFLATLNGGQGIVEGEVNRRIEKLMRTVEMTRNALCAQALTGKIDYMVATDSGKKERYVVDYGIVNSLTSAKKWNAAATTLADIMEDLRMMKNMAADKGFAGDMIFLAGSAAFGALAGKIMATPESQRFGASVSQKTINILGYEFTLDDTTYHDQDATGADVIKNEVDPNKVVGFIDGMAELAYCAIDDIEAGLQALPFFSKAWETKDPSGVNVIGESKPFPMIPAGAITWATVI